MNDAGQKSNRPDSTGQARHGLEQAEAGRRAGADQLDDARKDDPAGTEAAEQEASEGPAGRGLSR